MKVFIASSASKTINEKYINLANEAADYFSEKNYDLFFGAANYSMMGECYKSFCKNKRKIYAYTVPKYEKDFKKLQKAKCVKVSDTLQRFRKLYFRSDIILILPGGIGSLAELASAIEEFRTSGGNKKIIIYNYEGFYDNIINFIELNVKTGFIANDLIKCYKVVTNMQELKKVVEEK